MGSHPDGHRCARSREFRSTAGEAYWADHEPNRRGFNVARARLICCAAEGVKLVAIFSPEHGIAGRADARCCKCDRCGVPACRSTACMERRGGRRAGCLRGSTLLFSIFRMRECVFTLISRRWRTAWRRLRNIISLFLFSTGPNRSVENDRRADARS